MPDKKAQLKFDQEYCKNIEKALTKVKRIFNRIKPKDRDLRQGNLKSVNNILVDIKSYAFANTGLNPQVDTSTVVKHNQKSLQRVRNGKQSLKVLHNTLSPALKAETKQDYSSVLDIFNRFEDYLEKKVPD